MAGGPPTISLGGLPDGDVTGISLTEIRSEAGVVQRNPLDIISVKVDQDRARILVFVVAELVVAIRDNFLMATNRDPPIVSW